MAEEGKVFVTVVVTDARGVTTRFATSRMIGNDVDVILEAAQRARHKLKCQERLQSMEESPAGQLTDPTSL